MEPDRLTARQIEAARRAITRHIKRAGRVWIRVFPDVPVSKKPAEVRMGNGKGAPEYWAAASSRAACCSKSTACRATSPRRRLRSAAAKLPITTRFVARVRKVRRQHEGQRSSRQDRRTSSRTSSPT